MKRGGAGAIHAPASEIDRLDLVVVLDLLGAPSLKIAAIVHHRHISRDSQCDIEIVFDDDVADMRRQRVENRDQFAPLGGRQSGRRFVEQDESRRAGQSQGDFELTLLAVA